MKQKSVSCAVVYKFTRMYTTQEQSGQATQGTLQDSSVSAQTCPAVLTAACQYGSSKKLAALCKDSGASIPTVVSEGKSRAAALTSRNIGQYWARLICLRFAVGSYGQIAICAIMSIHAGASKTLHQPVKCLPPFPASIDRVRPPR